MSKRAKYSGGSGTGVTLQVPLADGQTRSVHVEHGHQLPEEIDGQRIPAAFRDSLLEQKANWSSVDQATGGAVSTSKDKQIDKADAGQKEG